MTRDASTVVVGGGIWGLSTAYHLARAGQADVRVLERNEEPIGETTPQAAGLVGQIRATPVMRRAIRYAIDLFTGFERETRSRPRVPPGRQPLLALTPERLASFQEHVEHANRSGVEARFVDAAEMSRLAPHMDVARVEGGYFVPEDGYVDPGQCARAYHDAARGPRREGPDRNLRDGDLGERRPGDGGGDRPRLRRGGARRGDGRPLDGGSRQDGRVRAADGAHTSPARHNLAPWTAYRTIIRSSA